MNANTFSKTRLAPTPSGYLHLGNIYSFLITTALAQSSGASVMLRIDDLHRDKPYEAFIPGILDTLHFLGIEWQDGPKSFDEFKRSYSQFLRMEMYNAALTQLKDSGMVYACTCSRTQILAAHPQSIYRGTCRDKNIPLDTKDACWRLRTEHDTQIKINTLAGAIYTTLPESLHDFVVKRKDDDPGYQLSSVLDDTHFGIDLIVRGEDLWDSSLAQLYLAAVLGHSSFLDTTFHHHPLIIGPGGEKMSKSGGATSVQFLREQGMSADSILSLIDDDLQAHLASLGLIP